MDSQILDIRNIIESITMTINFPMEEIISTELRTFVACVKYGFQSSEESINTNFICT